MAGQRTIAEICADAVEFLETVGGMTQGSSGGFIKGRAEAFRREMRRAAPDPALAEALDKIGELQALADKRAMSIVAFENEMGHMRQTIALLREGLQSSGNDAEPTPAPQDDAPEFDLVTTANLELAAAALVSAAGADAVKDPAAQEGEPPAGQEPEKDKEPAPPQIPTKHGSAGHSVNAVKARRFRLIGVSDGKDTGYVDEGSAGELANRNHIGPSTVYKLANTGKVGTRFRVEEVGA